MQGIFVVSHEVASNKTFILLVVREDVERSSIKIGFKETVEHLKRSIDSAAVPIAIPLILLEVDIDFWYEVVHRHEEEHLRIASKPDLLAFGSADLGNQESKKDEDLAEMTTALTRRAILTMDQRCHLAVVKRAAELLREAHLELVGHSKQRSGNASLSQKFDAVSQRLDAALEMCTRTISFAENIQIQLQLHTQMVENMIVGRETQLSRRDSVDMRVISAVTLIFLPATFVAVSMRS